MARASSEASRYIAEHRGEITEAWRARVAAIPELARLPPSALVDHLPEFLRELARWVAGDHTAAGRAYLTLVEGHALQRLGHGIELSTLLAEYQLLRECVLAHVVPHVAHDPEGIVAVNRAFDLAFAESVRRFAIHRDEVRERFVGILGHDLRNPLMALTFAAESILATPPCSQPSHAQLASVIKKGSARTSRMIDDIVDFALGQLGGGIPAVPQTCDMGEICRESVDELRSVHPDRQVALETRGNLVGSWDRDRVVQVISNLVANALAHGRDPITARAYEADDRQAIVTEVHDTGPAIPPETVDGLFDPFRRGANVRRTGLGLGLYIVRQIALAHGATCTVDSSEQAGTTFRIRWPRTPLEQVPRPYQPRG